MPTFGSLFAGIGGIDLGLERAGWTGRWQVEWDDYCQRVLAKHWPDIPRYGDITTVDWSGVERVDLIAGGFPCQPFSVAGERRGTADDRWLWPEFARAVRVLRPRLVLVENVPGLLVGGGMDDVLGGLAELGYDTTWESIPAAAVGAPHLRYRVWIVAHRTELGWPMADADDRGPFDAFRAGRNAARDGGANVADAECIGPARITDTAVRHNGHGPNTGWPEASGRAPGSSEAVVVADPASERLANGMAAEVGRGSDRPLEAAQPRPTGRSSRDRAWSDQWSTEPDVGRVAHGVPSRVDRLRSLGNAVVPQVVQVIGEKLIQLVDD